MSDTTETNRPISKASLVEKLLKRSRGATVADIMSDTGWQAHSVRAFLTGLRKKGKVLVKEARKSGEVSYRLTADAAPEPVIAAPTPAADSALTVNA